LRIRQKTIRSGTGSDTGGFFEFHRSFQYRRRARAAEIGAFICNPPLQGANTHAQVFRHLAKFGTMPAKEPQQDPFCPGSDG
jgi:hypothetical protein